MYNPCEEHGSIVDEATWHAGYHNLYGLGPADVNIIAYRWAHAPAFEQGNTASVGLFKQTTNPYSYYSAPLESRCTLPSVFLHVAMTLYNMNTIATCSVWYNYIFVMSFL